MDQKLTSYNTHLIVVLVVVVIFVEGLSYLKCLGLRRFKSDWGEIWHDCSSSIYAH